MIAYVAGPYSGNIEGNIRVARAVSILLWEKGYTVFCAHLNEALFEKDSKCTWEDFMQGNLEVLLECDFLVLLPKWEKSRGARIERGFAMSFNGVVVVLDALDTVEWWHIIAGALNIIVAFAIWIWIGLDDREAK